MLNPIEDKYDRLNDLFSSGAIRLFSVESSDAQ